ncbi:hypothetical protein JAAARDRAFT_193335 [Jaapia argillacea MUCL 33604]|uniref:Uncharacterized protein n=1 Tax=Jaapia argillacea MUCL 33604 TaxID=933084 RepID=A0A067PVQ1_9AGAM|nr:hypothetical protein JAAARDRAFT_193335 [Jaapia argillacea MUCL 33604]
MLALQLVSDLNNLQRLFKDLRFHNSPAYFDLVTRLALLTGDVHDGVYSGIAGVVAQARADFPHYFTSFSWDVWRDSLGVDEDDDLPDLEPAESHEVMPPAAGLD